MAMQTIEDHLKHVINNKSNNNSPKFVEKPLTELSPKENLDGTGHFNMVSGGLLPPIITAQKPTSGAALGRKKQLDFN